MDEVTKAAELAKAFIFELNAAYLVCLLNTSDAPRTFEELKAGIMLTSEDFKNIAKELRENVANGVDPEFPTRN